MIENTNNRELSTLSAEITALLSRYKELPEGCYEASQTVMDAENALLQIGGTQTTSAKQIAELKAIAAQLQRELAIFED